jgi:transcriptional regulator with XRE-family HTH domain
MADLNSTVRQRELGLRLCELRNAKNMTVEMVAKELLCSPTKISRAETGVRGATLRDVRDLCRIYEVDSATSTELMELARDAYQQGWWNKYDDIKITPLIGMEQLASAITSFGMYFFPALLQLADYARAIIKAWHRKSRTRSFTSAWRPAWSGDRSSLKGPTHPITG